MALSVKVPPGIALILAGSGLYWILSGQLIYSFTVLTPELFQSSSLGTTLILVVGVIFSVIGLWIISVDFDELAALFARRDGWVFTVPIGLVVLDVYLTLIGLSYGSRTMELNPFVASAFEVGGTAIVPFILSYMALSEGLALIMLSTGRRLFGASGPSRFLPFALICGVASFAPVSNFLLLAIPSAAAFSYFLGVIGMAGVSLGIYLHFQRLRS